LTRVNFNSYNTFNLFHELTNDKSEGLQSGIFESDGVLALAAACSKFCIAVPAPDQTWLVSSPDHFFD
jgi:hypothetical protein